MVDPTKMPPSVKPNTGARIEPHSLLKREFVTKYVTTISQVATTLHIYQPKVWQVILDQRNYLVVMEIEEDR